MHPPTIVEALIQPLYAKEDIIEVLSNGTSRVEWIHKNGSITSTANPYPRTMDLVRAIQEFAHHQGARLDPMYPANGGRWMDKSGQLQIRWHCVLPPIAPEGPLISLRKHQFQSLSLDSFLVGNELLEQISHWVLERRPLMICGPTGSGKSSFLSSLLMKHAINERVLILEQVEEIHCRGPRWVKMIARGKNYEGLGEFSLVEALEESLRLRPDRIVLGEVRGKEAFGLFHALLSGHDGVLATMHANTAEEAIFRLVSLLPDAVQDMGLTVFRKFAFVMMQRGVPPRVAAWIKSQNLSSTSLN